MLHEQLEIRVTYHSISMNVYVLVYVLVVQPIINQEVFVFRQLFITKLLYYVKSRISSIMHKALKL